MSLFGKIGPYWILKAETGTFPEVEEKPEEEPEQEEPDQEEEKGEEQQEKDEKDEELA